MIDNLRLFEHVNMMKGLVSDNNVRPYIIDKLKEHGFKDGQCRCGHKRTWHEFGIAACIHHECYADSPHGHEVKNEYHGSHYTHCGIYIPEDNLEYTVWLKIQKPTFWEFMFWLLT